MTHRRRLGLLLFACLLAGLVLAPTALRRDQEFDGPFIVADGETMIASGQRLRLRGIDAPEIGQRCRTAEGGFWSCGASARAALETLLAQAGVVCAGRDRDENQRILVACRVGKGDIGASLVRTGLVLNEAGYETEQSDAERRKLGLWAGAFDRPEEWRRLHPRGEMMRRPRDD